MLTWINVKYYIKLVTIVPGHWLVNVERKKVNDNQKCKAQPKATPRESLYPTTWNPQYGCSQSEGHVEDKTKDNESGVCLYVSFNDSPYSLPVVNLTVDNKPLSFFVDTCATYSSFTSDRDPSSTFVGIDDILLLSTESNGNGCCFQTTTSFL